jgi:manganese/zinc/iron transport system permease protein
MSQVQIEIQLVGILVAIACALPGVFLVLRRMALMSDAISHTILLGIVLAFFIVEDLNSPFLMLAATLSGVLTVLLVEILNKTRLVREDAAIGLVFPALFSIGVILISRYAGSIHLDTDAVLLGELAFVPFDRMLVFGRDIGPRAAYIIGAILLINVGFITLFYKELKLATFDAGLAAALGFMPGLIHYGLMTLVSITAVGAFDAVGSILVVGLMIGPPATAYLLTDRLPIMLLLSAGFGAMSAVSGYWLARWLDASIAGSMATMVGVGFVLTLLLAPTRGLVATALRRARQRVEFAQTMLIIHLFNHEGLPEWKEECRLDHLERHMRWPPPFAAQIVTASVRNGILRNINGYLALTEKGRQAARRAIEERALDPLS